MLLKLRSRGWTLHAHATSARHSRHECGTEAGRKRTGCSCEHEKREVSHVQVSLCRPLAKYKAFLRIRPLRGAAGGHFDRAPIIKAKPRVALSSASNA